MFHVFLVHNTAITLTFCTYPGGSGSLLAAGSALAFSGGVPGGGPVVLVEGVVGATPAAPDPAVALATTPFCCAVGVLVFVPEQIYITHVCTMANNCVRNQLDFQS